MSKSAHDTVPEQKENLWMLTLPPGIWAFHFLASYLTAAIWCAKYAGPSGSLGTARAAIGIYTLLALSGLAATTWLGVRRVSFKQKDIPHADDKSADRHRFLGFTLLLLSGLSIVATLFVSAVILFVETCD
jgi:hypothetical protein